MSRTPESSKNYWRRHARRYDRVIRLLNRRFPVVTRFQDAQLDALIESSGFEVTDARWVDGVLPVRFVVAVRR